MMVTKNNLKKIYNPLPTQQISTEIMPEILGTEFFFLFPSLLPCPFLPFSLSLLIMGLFTDTAFKNINHWNRVQGISQAT